MTNIVTVNFRGDTLFGFEADDGTFIALKPIVEAMGLNWSGQLQRVKRDPILSEGMCVMHTPWGRGGDQEAVCLKLDLVNGWLFGIDSTRIKDGEARERVQAYQRECYGVLAKHFHGKRADKPTAKLGEGEDTTEAEGNRVRMVTESRQTFGTRAAGELWFALGLPVVPAMLVNKNQLDLLDYSRIQTAADEQKAA